MWALRVVETGDRGCAEVRLSMKTDVEGGGDILLMSMDVKGGGDGKDSQWEESHWKGSQAEWRSRSDGLQIEIGSRSTSSHLNCWRGESLITVGAGSQVKNITDGG